MTANTNTYKPEQITALYARLSQEDALEGDSNSIVNQDAICQGYFHPRVRKSKNNALALLISDRIRNARALKYTAL